VVSYPETSTDPILYHAMDLIFSKPQETGSLINYQNMALNSCRLQCTVVLAVQHYDMQMRLPDKYDLKAPRGYIFFVNTCAIPLKTTGISSTYK